MHISEQDRVYLKQCISLAREAVEAGDDPFGSVLVSPSTTDNTGKVLFTSRNRINTTHNISAHPEFDIAMWAQQHLTPAERAQCTVYTSGEHCAMCSAAHGYAGLGRIVFASSCGMLGKWIKEFGGQEGKVKMVPIGEVLKGVEVDGPDEGLAGEVRRLHEEKFRRRREREGKTG